MSEVRLMKVILKKLKNATLYIGIAMLMLIIILAATAPYICRYDPVSQDLYATLQAPGAGEHLLGTDQLGRDMLSRLLYAARTDLVIMAAAEVIPFISGVFIGMVSGYFGGRIEWIISLLTDTFIAFPYYLLVIVVAFVTGAGIHGIFVTFMIVGWLIYARVAKPLTASMRSSEWVQAAKLMGYSDIRIIIREILPNVLPQAVVVLMTDMAALLVAIVTLGYLGIGITAPAPDWGSMISDGQALISSAPYLSLIPGLMVVYTGISLSFIGDGLADRWR